MPRIRGCLTKLTWHGPDLVMNRPNEQGIPFNSGLFDHAVVTLKWASYGEFETTCGGIG